MLDNTLDSVQMDYKRECLKLRDDFNEAVKDKPDLIDKHKARLEDRLNSISDQSYDNLAYRCSSFKSMEQGPLKDYIRSLRSEWNHVKVQIYMQIAEEPNDIKRYLNEKREVMKTYCGFWIQDGVGFAERKKQNEKS